MININFRCDKYGDHTAHIDDLVDVQVKRFEQDEEFEAANFVDECTVYPEVFSDVDTLGILKKKQDLDIQAFQKVLFGEEED